MTNLVRRTVYVRFCSGRMLKGFGLEGPGLGLGLEGPGLGLDLEGPGLGLGLEGPGLGLGLDILALTTSLDREHDFQLLQLIKYKLHRQSFITDSLFKIQMVKL